MFRFLTNAELFVSEARHITHCAMADSQSNALNPATTNAATTKRHTFRSMFRISLRSATFCRRWRRTGGTQIFRAKTVGEKHQQHQADADDQRRHDRQYQVEPLEPQVHEVGHN